jgi:hypothetical protein
MQILTTWDFAVCNSLRALVAYTAIMRSFLNLFKTAARAQPGGVTG